MSDLISRQAAIDAVHKSIFDFFDICDDDEESPMTYKDELLLELNKAITTQIKALASVQSIKAEPIKHGHWVHGKELSRDYIGNVCVSIHYDKWWCSECNYPVEGQPLWTYCPSCGADMRGEGDG